MAFLRARAFHQTCPAAAPSRAARPCSRSNAAVGVVELRFVELLVVCGILFPGNVV